MSEISQEQLDLLKAACDAIHASGRRHWYIKPEIHEIFEASGLQIQPRSFYSPLVEPDRAEAYDWSLRPFPLDKINFNHEAWHALLRDINVFAPELLSSEFPKLGSKLFPWNNDFYSGLDALALYAIVRRSKPNRIIEIGSGFSTHISLAAIRQNGRGSMTCVEPYPMPVLRSIGDEVRIVEMKVEEVDTSLFHDLGEDDILFIDSSHVAKFQSDVNHEIFSILPSLRKGVQVHIHDIFFPSDYPKEWIEDRRWHWNEQYLLYAFLLENPNWELFMPTFYTVYDGAAVLDRYLEHRPSPHNGCSLWLKRIGSVDSKE